MSRTFVNTNASATPSDWGLEIMMAFVPGDIPSGYIAEPQIAGVTQNYNVSATSLQHSGDGSLILARYYITRSTALASGASITFDFVKVAGSFDYTSAIDETDFVAETDFRWRISKCHTARPSYPLSQSVLALTIDNTTGTVSGVKVLFDNGTIAANNVRYGAGASGSGSGGQISVTGGVGSVINPGAGYSYVGTGTFDTKFNDIIAAVASGGNNANGVAWEWTAQGAACDEIKGTAIIHASLPHYVVRFYLKRWKKTNGSLLTYSFVIRGNIGVIDNAVTMHNYTYDLDVFEMVSSATAIRGASVGYEPHTTIPHHVGTAVYSFGPDTSDDWLIDNAARNAVKLVLRQEECIYLRSTRLIHSYATQDSTRALPTADSYWNDGGDDSSNGLARIGRYRPAGCFGIRHGLQNNGSDNNLFAGAPECLYYYWLACYHARQSDALTYLNNVAVSTAGAASAAADLGGGMLIEPTTTYLPNFYPSGEHTFTGMAPTRQSWWINSLNILGSSHPRVWNTTNNNGSESFTNTSHQYNLTFHPYVLLGHEWMRDNVIYGGTSPIGGLSYSTKNVTIGANTWRRVMCGGQSVTTANVRIPAWYRYNSGLAARVLTEGSSERAHCEQILSDNYSYLNALAPYTGTFTYLGSPTTKNPDLSNSGVYPDEFTEESTDIDVSYMGDYERRGDTTHSWLFQGTALGDIIKAYRDYRANFYVGRFLGGHIYWSQVQRARMRVNSTNTTTGVGVNFRNGMDYANAGTSYAIHGSSAPQGQVALAFKLTAGSDIVTLVAYNSLVPTPLVLWGTTEIASGAGIVLTKTNLSSTQTTGVIPLGFDIGPTVYYWQRLTSTTGKLCTDAALTTPMIAQEDQNGNVFFFVISNIDPPNLSYGTHHNGVANNGLSRVAWTLGTLRHSKALSLPGDDTTELTSAISRLAAVWTAIGGSYGDTIYTNYVDTIS